MNHHKIRCGQLKLAKTIIATFLTIVTNQICHIVILSDSLKIQKVLQVYKKDDNTLMKLYTKIALAFTFISLGARQAMCFLHIIFVIILASSLML